MYLNNLFTARSYYHTDTNSYQEQHTTQQLN